MIIILFSKDVDPDPIKIQENQFLKEIRILNQNLKDLLSGEVCDDVLQFVSQVQT